MAALGDGKRVARSCARWIRRAAAKDAAEDGEPTALWELPPYSCQLTRRAPWLSPPSGRAATKVCFIPSAVPSSAYPSEAAAHDACTSWGVTVNVGVTKP